MSTGFQSGVFTHQTASPKLTPFFEGTSQTFPPTHTGVTSYRAVSPILPSGGWTAATSYDHDHNIVEVTLTRQPGASAAVLTQLIHAFTLPASCPVSSTRMISIPPLNVKKG